MAFQTAARAPRNVPALVAELGLRGVGVVAGQVEDIAQSPTPNPHALSFIYEHKTADLFMAAAAMGALAGGATPEQVARLRGFARDLGLAFQYEDDLLDGDSPLARAETERRVRDLTAQAIAALENLPGDTAFLSHLAARLARRTR